MEPSSVARAIDLLSRNGRLDVTVHFIPSGWFSRFCYNRRVKAHIPYDPSKVQVTGRPILSLVGTELMLALDDGWRVFDIDDIVAITGPVPMTAIGDGGALIPTI